MCYRCNKAGRHYLNECSPIDTKCEKCDCIGHFVQACQQNKSKNVPSGHANAIRAHLETLSPNQQIIIINAQQNEKAEDLGLVYSVESNDVENPEQTDRHQKFAMFGHLN